MSFRHKPNRLPLYAKPDAAEYLRTMFRYIFDSNYKFGGLARLELKPVEGKFDLFGAKFVPVPVIHDEKHRGASE